MAPVGCVEERRSTVPGKGKGESADALVATSTRSGPCALGLANAAVSNV